MRRGSIFAVTEWALNRRRFVRARHLQESARIGGVNMLPVIVDAGDFYSLALEDPAMLRSQICWGRWLERQAVKAWRLGWHRQARDLPSGLKQGYHGMKPVHTQACFIELAPFDDEHACPLRLSPISAAVFLVLIGAVGFGVQDSPEDRMKVAPVQQGQVLVAPAGKLVKMVHGTTTGEESAIVLSICPDGFRIPHD